MKNDNVKRRLLSKTDIAVLFAALLLCAALFFIPRLFGSGKLIAEISVDGQVVKTVDLNEVTDSYTVDINNMTFEIGHGYIRVLESDCPDKTCVKSGKLTKRGDTALCAPNAALVEIVSKTESFITY